MMIFSKYSQQFLIILLLVICSFFAPKIAVFYHGYIGFLPALSLFFFIFRESVLGTQRKIRINMEINENISLLWLLLWYITGVTFTYIRGANDYAFYLDVITTVYFFYFGLYIKEYNEFKPLLIFFVLFFLSFNIFFTLGGIENNTTARELLDEDAGAFNIQGTTSFWGVIGVFMPVFIANTLNCRRDWKFFTKISLILFITYKLISSGFATPIGLFIVNFIVIGILMLFIKGRFTIFQRVIGFIFLITISNFLINFFLSTSNNMFSDVQYRFTNFIENPFSGGYEEEDGEFSISRFILMKFSWNSFLKNPFFGGGGNFRTDMYSNIAGGHSSFVDSLAILGILGGGGSLILFCFTILKNAIKHFIISNSFESMCNLSSVIAFLIGGIINPYWSGVMFYSLFLFCDIYIMHKNNLKVFN
jgi:hypothetical protein